MVESKYHRRLFIMAKKKEVYHVKPLTEGKKNIIASLIEEYDIETAVSSHRLLRSIRKTSSGLTGK